MGFHLLLHIMVQKENDSNRTPALKPGGRPQTQTAKDLQWAAVLFFLVFDLFVERSHNFFPGKSDEIITPGHNIVMATYFVNFYSRVFMNQQTIWVIVNDFHQYCKSIIPYP